MPLKSTFQLLLFVGALTLCRPAQCQDVTPHRSQVPAAPGQEDDENRDRITREMAKKANQERQAALKNDTEELLKLATELKAYVDKSNENVLSLDVIKKAERIEKLAHSVREKMKGPN